MNRREFLQFLGASGVISTLPTNLAFGKNQSAHFTPLSMSSEDKLRTIEGLNYKILLRWRDDLNSRDRFGFNNDFIAFHPLTTTSAILWVNHEYMHSLFINGLERNKKNIDLERLEVGGSLVEIKKNKESWEVVKDSKYNRRIDATTEIPFDWDEPIMGSKTAVGTMSNCAGGKTPWGTILTCEENYDMFWGDRDRAGNKKTSENQWDKIYPLPPEHYGWVVEVDPLTGKSKKLISMGRCAHECAAVTMAQNGKIVAYTGDDSNNEHLYKFISNSDSSLSRGKLYVASFEKGQWLSMDINDQPILKKNFKDQTEIQIFAREAAKMLGATPLARPEDIEFDPLTGHVFVALTNNKSVNNYHGSILKIIETDNDPGAMTFKHETFITGGKDKGFSCPDNIVFDPKGNLWFTTDMAGSSLNKGPYKGLGNNGLYVFIRSGTYSGEVIRVATAPIDAEFTGPCFSPDYKTLFLSVQHPGETTTDLKKPTSTWPDGGIPKSSVVMLTGATLNKIVEGKL